METATGSAEILRQEISKAETKLQELKDLLAKVEAHSEAESQPNSNMPVEDKKIEDVRKWPLTQEEYSRYGRQMIVSSIGIQGG